MVIIINGAPGVGKTTTAELLTKSIDNSAIINGDYMLGINPLRRTLEETYLRYEVIATVAQIYSKHAYSTIIISFTYPSNELLDKQIKMLNPLGKVKTFSLVCGEKMLRKRHSNDIRLRASIDHSLGLNDQIRNLIATEIIDNSKLSVTEVVDQIKNKLEEK